MGYIGDEDEHVMTPEHVSWRAFKQALKGPDGINMRIEGAKAKWGCSHHRLRPLTRRILSRYEGIDIEATLKIFDELGGKCDCEVVFSVEDNFWKQMGGGEILIKAMEKDKD